MSNEDLNISASLAEMSDVSFDTPIRQAILGDTFWRTPTRPEQQLQHHQQTANNTTTTSMTPTSQTCHSIAGQSESRIWTGLKSSATNSSAEQPSSDHHQLLTSRVQAQQACSSTSLTNVPTKANTAPQNQKFQYLNTANHSVAAILKGADVDEENLHMLENDDIRLLTPVVGVQLQIRAFRDCRKNQCGVIRPQTSRVNRVPVASPINTARVPGKLYRPSYHETNAFINSLKLGAQERLQGRFSSEEIERYKHVEPVPKKLRTRLQRLYVPYVVEKYTEWFGNQHVVPDIIQHVAEKLMAQFPSLRDDDSTPDKPTFIYFFNRRPPSGQLYEAFKNANRNLPDELKLRRSSQNKGRKRKAAEEQVPVETTENELYEMKVKEIETAPPEKRRKLLVETFTERNSWVVNQGPGMVKILNKFNVFVRFPEEIGHEFDRINEDLTAAGGIRRLEKLMASTAELDDPVKRVKKVINSCGLKPGKHLAAIDVVIRKGDPAVVSANYGSVCLCVREDGTIFVCIYKGFNFEVKSVADGLNKMLMLFYILWIDFPSTLKTFFYFLAALHGETDKTISPTMNKLRKSLL